MKLWDSNTSSPVVGWSSTPDGKEDLKDLSLAFKEFNQLLSLLPLISGLFYSFY